MSFTYVQGAGNTAVGATSLTATFTGAVTAGDLIVVSTGYYTGTAATATVTDSNGNTYTAAHTYSGSIGYASNEQLGVYYAVTTLGATANTFVVTLTLTAADNLSLAIAEFTAAGIPFVDAYATGSGTSNSPATGNLAPTGVDLIVACCAWDWASGSRSGSAGSGFTQIYEDSPPNPTSIGFIAEYQTGVTTTLAATFSLAQSMGWSALGVAFSTLPGFRATAGSYSLTGTAAILEATVLTAGEGSYSLTGTAASLGLGFGDTAVAGSYALTGTAASLLDAHKLAATAGQYSYTGKPATLFQPFTMTTVAGVYTSTGESASLILGQGIGAATGVYACTGQPAGLGPSDLIAAATGVYTVGRISAGLLDAHDLPAVTGIYSLTGKPASFFEPFTLTSVAGVYTVTGKAAGLDWGHGLESSGPGVYVLTGQMVTMLGSQAGSLFYTVYANTGIGDPINYNTGIDTTSGLTFTTGALAYPGTWRFGVRASDLYGQEQNVDCAVTIILSATGVDITNMPVAPVALRALARMGGAIRVEWGYPAVTNRAKTPTGFHVYRGTGGIVNYTTPVATVLWGTMVAGSFVANLTGLTNGATYTMGVRAYNATAEETNTNTVSATAVSVGPTAVESLLATATS